MKDTRDNNTAEILQIAGGKASLPPPAVVRPAPKRTTEQIVHVAIQREKQRMDSWLPVAFVAKHFSVSTRRVRTLLTAGRLQGRQLENGYWEVLYPWQFTYGRRGPPAFRGREKKAEQVEERKA